MKSTNHRVSESGYSTIPHALASFIPARTITPLSFIDIQHEGLDSVFVACLAELAVSISRISPMAICRFPDNVSPSSLVRSVSWFENLAFYGIFPRFAAADPGPGNPTGKFSVV